MNLLTLAWSKFLFPRTRVLRQYEIAALNLLVGSLDPAAAETVRAQVRAGPSVQRHLGVETVFMWRHDEPFASHKAAPRAANTSLARVGRIFGRSATNTVRCDIEFRDGLLFRLFFNHVLQGSDTVAWDSVQLLDGLATMLEACPAKGGEIVQAVGARHHIEAVLAPRPVDYVANYLAGLVARVPDDLRDLLNETNGFLVDGFEFVGTHAYPVWTSKGAAHAFLVKEDAPSVLCLLEGTDQPSVCIYDTSEHELKNLGASFVKAMDSFLAEQNAISQ